MKLFVCCLLPILLFATHPAVAGTFETGAPVQCDDRYPWTCDARGWREKPASRHPLRRPSTNGLVAPLAAKAAEIVAVCGSRIISAVRNTLVAGTRRVSLHATGQAVDLVGNPGCIYAALRDWPGGYSTDYGRVRHVHVSYGGREHGRRFAHKTGRSKVAIRHNSRPRG